MVAQIYAVLGNEWSQWRRDASRMRPMVWEYVRLWRARSSLKHRIVLIMFVVVGMVMRLQFVGQPIRTDEAVTYLQYASGNFLQPLYDYSAPNNHILHTIGVSVTTRLLDRKSVV